MTNCRYCGHPGAYDTGFTVECSNPQCEHFSRDQRRMWMAANKCRQELQHEEQEQKLNELLEEYLNESSDPDKTPTYPWGLIKRLSSIDDLDEDD